MGGLGSVMGASILAVGRRVARMGGLGSVMGASILAVTSIFQIDTVSHH